MKITIRTFLTIAAAMAISVNGWSAAENRPAKSIFCVGYNTENASKIQFSVNLKTDAQGKPEQNLYVGYYEYTATFKGTGVKLNASAQVPSNGIGALNILLWSDASHSPVDDEYVGRILIESSQGQPSSLRSPAHGWLMNPESKKIGFDFLCQING